MIHTKEYIEYLESTEWKAKREKKLKESEYKCAHTNSKSDCRGALQVHHLNYNNLGNEPLSDLLVLCEYHHKKADRNRQAKNKAKFYQKRLDGWASKVYGENWEDRMDNDYIGDRFDDWLEKREREEY